MSASADELNHCKGVTSDIQTQIDGIRGWKTVNLTASGFTEGASNFAGVFMYNDALRLFYIKMYSANTTAKQIGAGNTIAISEFIPAKFIDQNHTYHNLMLHTDSIGNTLYLRSFSIRSGGKVVLRGNVLANVVSIELEGIYSYPSFVEDDYVPEPSSGNLTISTANKVKFYPSTTIVGSTVDSSKDYKFYYDNNAMLITSSDIPKVLCMSDNIENGIQPVDIAKPIVNDIKAVNNRINTQTKSSGSKCKEITTEGVYYCVNWADAPTGVSSNGTVIVRIIPFGDGNTSYRTLLYFTYVKDDPRIYMCKCDTNVFGDWAVLGNVPDYTGTRNYVGHIMYTGGSWNAVCIFPFDIVDHYNIECTSYNVCGAGTGTPSAQNAWGNSFTVAGNYITSSHVGKAVLMTFKFTKK